MRFAVNSHLAGARCGFAAAGCVANRQLLDNPRLSVAIDASVSLGQHGARTLRTFGPFHAWSGIRAVVTILQSLIGCFKRSMSLRLGVYSVLEMEMGAPGPPPKSGVWHPTTDGATGPLSVVYRRTLIRAINRSVKGCLKRR